MCVCVCVCVCMYVYIYICIYIHIYVCVYNAIKYYTPLYHLNIKCIYMHYQKPK